MDISFQSPHKEGESHTQTHCGQEVLEIKQKLKQTILTQKYDLHFLFCFTQQ